MKTRILIYAVIILLFIACKKDADSYNANIQAVSVPTADTTAVEAASYDYSIDKSEDKLDAPESTETKIIKNGNLKFQTGDLDKTYSQIQGLVKKYKASIKNDSQSNDEYGLSRSLNIRIPNNNFDAFVNELSKGVNYFDQKEISSEDVTEEYIDVASRIKTKKVLEERYYELLKKATKISEMLEIEKKLSEIREEIEAKEGRLNYLQNQVSMSTLNISFYKPVAQGQKATVSYGGRIGNAIISGFNGISNFFIELLGIWPLIVTLVVLFILIRKRFKRKKKKDAIEN